MYIPAAVALMLGLWALFDFLVKNQSFLWTATALIMLANILPSLGMLVGSAMRLPSELELFLQVLFSLGFGIVVLLYLWKSRRIRVTFRHQLREDDEFINELLAEKAQT
jgi:hypothetical protein